MKSSLITNYTDVTFLATIQSNLRTCSSFCFAVSFIKKAGLDLLKNDIAAAIERGAKGKLITSTYQSFTDVESLKWLLNLSLQYQNFECHLDDECFFDVRTYSTNGFHTKGYIFEYSDRAEIIIGSSNITRYALLKNIEWDLVVNCSKDSDVYNSSVKEFDYLWGETLKLDSDRISIYGEKISFAIERWDMDYDIVAQRIVPNYMQRKALKELNRNRALGIQRSLIISATGSGKTYLAAFDALNFGPKKLLYVVHEGSILRRALETFQDVFNGQKVCGLYNGETKEIEADFLFSTNVSMCKSLDSFRNDEFDYIIIDECHHAVAETYKKIIEYFEPEFMLGLTATENRMDNQDVVGLFGDNIPFELRLRDAIINDLIVPFHYYGIRDKLVDYSLTDSAERRLIAQMADASNCEFIHQQIEAHRKQGQKLKALAFCRNIQHARMMAENLGEYYKTAFLSGKNKTGERIRAFNDLQSDNKELEILFAVDILNEGVDIPGVNMVLFLRPTESSTIFIQQLGRGLRKYPGKDYVTILDFIGNNYKRSVHIALALGSLSKNSILEKKLLKYMILNDFKPLGLDEYGVKIFIDSLSKEEIIDSIESENFNSLRYMKTDYFNFKNYLNSHSYPKHIDYLNSDYAPNLLKFMKIKIGGNKTESYYNFLKGIEEDNLPVFTSLQVNVVNYLSGLLPLVRRHEYLIVQRLLEGERSKEEIHDALLSEIPNTSETHTEHALKFLKEKDVVLEISGVLKLNCEVEPEFIEFVSDLLQYGITDFTARYRGASEDDFLLWQDYRVEQVQLKILNNPGNIMKGTYYKDGNMYVFAGLKKDRAEDDPLNYKDKFLSSDVFQWESVARITKDEEESQKQAKNVFVFVRKVKSENGITLPFTYVGTGKLMNPRKGVTNNGSILYDIHMNQELPDYLMEDFKWIA